MKKYLTQLNVIFGLEVITVLLASIGIIPREAILIWTGLAVFYMIFSPVDDALWLVIASIPLFAALPITDNFDTLANWRILVFALFLCLFFKQGVSINIFKRRNDEWGIRENLKHYALDYLALTFLIISLISFVPAHFKILAVKKFIFLINIFLLFLVVRNLTRDEASILKMWRAAAVGAATAIVVALAQLFAVFFMPLITFWQFWANRAIGFFYGQELADLLSYANTWFAYYRSAPPTLRLFSVFPDSHSFAMFCLLTVPVLSGLAAYYSDRRRIKNILFSLIGLALFGAVFSGSRGVWVGGVPVVAAAVYFWAKKIDPVMIKRALAGLAMFAAIFIVSFGYPILFYKVQSWQTGQPSGSMFYFFERARSIADLDEISNKGRLEIWRASFVSLKHHPVFGVGLGNFVSVLDEGAGAAKKGASAHNLYLDIACEIGVFGALALLAMFADILWTSWLVWRTAPKAHFRLFGLFFGLYFIWIISYSFFDVVLFNDKVLLFFMVGAATLYSLRNIIFDPKKI